MKSERLTRLQAAIMDGQMAFNRASVGRTVDVLLDRTGSRPGQLHGRSPHMQSVHVVAPAHLLGQIVPVRIEDGRALSLTGLLMQPESLIGAEPCGMVA